MPSVRSVDSENRERVTALAGREREMHREFRKELRYRKSGISRYSLADSPRRKILYRVFNNVIIAP